MLHALLAVLLGRGVGGNVDLAEETEEGRPEDAIESVSKYVQKE